VEKGSRAPVVGDARRGGREYSALGGSRELIMGKRSATARIRVSAVALSSGIIMRDFIRRTQEQEQDQEQDQDRCAGGMGGLYTVPRAVTSRN